MSAEIRDGIVVATERVHASPTVVFSYFTDPSLLMTWIAEQAEIEPRPGGRFYLEIGTVSLQGTYLVVDPPHRVVFTWGVAGDRTLPAGSSTVEVVLTPEGEETIVVLTHRGLRGSQLDKHCTGWADQLARLQRSAKEDASCSGTPASAPDVTVHVRISKPADEVWRIVGDFGDLKWLAGATPVLLDGDLRTFELGGHEVRHRLLRHDQDARSYTYVLAGDADTQTGAVSAATSATISVDADGPCAATVTWSSNTDKRRLSSETLSSFFSRILHQLKDDIERR